MRSKVQRLLIVAKNQLKAGELDSDGVVHSVRECARMWNVSTVTAHAVLRRLLSERHIVKRSSGTRFLRPGTASEPGSRRTRTPAVPRYRSIAADLREELVSGEFEPPFVFPLVSELCGRFSSSYYTIVRALEILEKDGLLERKGKRYVACRISPSQSVRSKYCIVGRRKSFIDPFVSQVVNAVEQTLSSSVEGICCRICSATFTPPADPIPSGLLLLSPELYTRSAASLEYPVTVLTQSEEYLSSRMPSHHISIGPDNEAASRAIANRLAHSGHSRIAFFSHIDPETAGWVKKRLTGLQFLYRTEEIDSPRKMTTFIRSETSRSPDNLTGKRTALRNTITALTGNREWSQSVPQDITQKVLFRSADQVLMIEDLGEAFASDFEKALTTPGITAWVCVNDQLAASAYQFLIPYRQYGRNPIALISYDNSVLSQLLGITSYDFRYDRMGRLAIQYFLKPNSRPAGSRNRIATTGEIVERQSGISGL